MTEFARRYPHRLWQVYVAKRPDTAPGAWGDPVADWDDAVDTYDEAAGDPYGWHVWVIGLDAATGTLMDQTDEAFVHLRERLETRGDDLPAWMEDAA